MEVETDLVTFLINGIHYLESERGVAASLLDEETYSVRLKGGYYANGLSVDEAIEILCYKP